MNKYFECKNCGQVVQGWNASLDISCCANKDMQEIDGPDVGRQVSAADLDEVIEAATKVRDRAGALYNILALSEL